MVLLCTKFLCINTGIKGGCGTMCGIVGFIGEQPAAPILLEGLSKLEYRGYDSAGIAVRNEKTDKIAIVKAKGRLKILAEKTDNGKSVRGTCGIGHTRWATHGEPSENNAHPHCTDDKSVVLVHNGIIENYQELKTKLQKTGYTFYSQTDTEIAVADYKTNLNYKSSGWFFLCNLYKNGKTRKRCKRMNDSAFLNSRRTGIFKDMSNGTICIPKDLRDNNGLEKNDRVELIPMQEGIYIRKAYGEKKCQ